MKYLHINGLHESLCSFLKTMYEFDFSKYDLPKMCMERDLSGVMSSWKDFVKWERSSKQKSTYNISDESIFKDKIASCSIDDEKIYKISTFKNRNNRVGDSYPLYVAIESQNPIIVAMLICMGVHKYYPTMILQPKDMLFEHTNPITKRILLDFYDTTFKATMESDWPNADKKKIDCLFDAIWMDYSYIDVYGEVKEKVSSDIREYMERKRNKMNNIKRTHGNITLMEAKTLGF